MVGQLKQDKEGEIGAEETHAEETHDTTAEPLVTQREETTAAAAAATDGTTPPLPAARMAETQAAVVVTDESKDDTPGEAAPFVNEGLIQWEENRATWLRNSDTSDSTGKAAVPLDVDAIIDLIFSQRWRNQEGESSSFPQPVPLPQMVDILVDLWEAEGLDV